MGRPLLRREGRTASLGVCTASSCVWKPYRRYGGKTLVGADMVSRRRFCTFGGTREGGRGARGAAAFAGAADGAGLAAVFFVRQNRQRRFLPQCKRRSRRPCGGDAMRSGVVISVLMGEKTVLARGFAVQFIAVKRNVARRFLLRNEISNGYPLLRNGIGRAALRRYKPAWRR